jgi:cellulose synthase/poly-beta-1,6-N-acetylglucosamine synthase-like glycosyltransferase
MATVDSVGEDKEVELKLIRQGITIEYVHDALILDEKTQKSDVFVNQRRRWIAAQLSYFKDYFPDGLKMLLTKGNIDYFDKVLQMLLPPRILSVGFIFIVTALLYLSNLLAWMPDQVVFYANYQSWAILFLVTAFTLLIAVPRKFYSAKTLKAVLYIPWGFVLMVISLLKIKGANKKFIHTEHSHSESIKHN